MHTLVSRKANVGGGEGGGGEGEGGGGDVQCVACVAQMLPPVKDGLQTPQSPEAAIAQYSAGPHVVQAQSQQ